MTESVTINVGGMTCAACQAHVQRALQEVPGVAKASVNLITGQATVAFDPHETAPTSLVEAVLETGYGAELPPAGQTAFQEQEQREQTQAQEARELGIKAIVSLALGGIAMALSMGAMSVPGIRYVLLAITVFVMAWAGRRIFTG